MVLIQYNHSNKMTVISMTIWFFSLIFDVKNTYFFVIFTIFSTVEIV